MSTNATLKVSTDTQDGAARADDRVRVFLECEDGVRAVCLSRADWTRAIGQLGQKVPADVFGPDTQEHEESSDVPA